MRTTTRALRLRLGTAIVLCAGLVAGCGGDPTASEEYASLDRELARAHELLAVAEAECEERRADAENLGSRAAPFDLDALAAAWGSGDAEAIRTFYTEDAVMIPFGHILSTLSSHPMPEYWDIAGPDIDREAAEHEGATLELLTFDQIGNMVVTTGQWTFPEQLYPDLADVVIQTADVIHLRNGKIWRHFGDFEVYVDGSLIEM